MPDPTTDATEPSGPAPPTGRRRLLSALHTRWSRGQAVVGVLLAVLGFAAVVQVRANDAEQVFVGDLRE